MDKKVLFIVRGIPGSGKSTLANIIADRVCSADDYHYVSGEYKFDVNKIKDAHEWCRRKCDHYMRIGVPKIAVANTNTQEKEFKHYMDLGKKHGYEIHSIIVENRHGSKNIHDVPEKTIEKMKKRFEIKL